MIVFEVSAFVSAAAWSINQGGDYSSKQSSIIPEASSSPPIVLGSVGSLLRVFFVTEFRGRSTLSSWREGKASPSGTGSARAGGAADNNRRRADASPSSSCKRLQEEEC